MSVDATFKDNEDNDFVAIQVWAKLRADMYLVDSINKHLDFPSTMREIIRLRGMYRDCKVTLIEDKANGPAIIQMLRTRLGGIIPVDPRGGKTARVNAIAGAIESGNVHLPSNKLFTQAFVDQFSAFPKGKHDDMVDAASQALNRFIYYSAEPAIITPENPMYKAFPGMRRPTAASATGKGAQIHVI